MAEKKQDSYLRSEVEKSTSDYFGGDELATQVWINKYCLKDSDGNLYEKNPDDMHRRLSKELARIERKYPNPLSEEKIYETLKGFKRIVPQGSPMAGIGNDFQVTSISNCFVIGNEKDADSYGGIFKLDQEVAQLQKRRAGVGMDLSFIRPKGTPVKNSAITSTGVVPFMERYSNTTREVAQDGRRGALLESISIKHPDSEDFIDAKMIKGKVTGANVSIRIDDEFMDAAINDKSYITQYPVDSKNPKITKEIDAKKLWKKIIHNAWKCVPYDTEIPIYENGVFKIIKIGDLCENKNKNHKYEAISLNLHTLKISKKTITDFQKYKNNKKVFKLKTKSLKSVSATNDHILYVLRDEKVYNIPISQIKIGDYLICSKQIKLDNSHNDEVELDVKYFNNNSSVYFDNFKEVLNNDNIIKTLGSYKKTKKATQYIYCGKLPVKEYLKIKDKIKPQNLKILPNFSGNKNVYIDQKYKLTENLMKFIGIWYAEGSYHGNSLRLHININEFEDYKYIFEYVKNKFHLNYTLERKNKSLTVCFFSSFLINLMKSMGVLYNNKEKIIPNQFFSLSKKLIASFLSGLYSGDGTCSGGIISISQSNKKMMKDIQTLLLVFNIHSKLYVSEKKGIKIINKKKCNIKNNYKIDIYKEFNKTFYSEISFLLKEKNKLLKKNITTSIDFFSIPLKKETFNKLRLFSRKKTSKRLIESNKKNHIIDKKIYENDVFYDEVIEVREDKKQNYVYDITVKDNHTFILANSIAISNSAEPGLLFWNNIINESIPDCYADLGFKTTSTNPCGEITLCPSDSCRLLAINLYGYVNNPFTPDSSFNWDLFKNDAVIAERLMDDIVDLELEKIDKIIEKIENDPEEPHIKEAELNLWKNIKDKAERGRRTGLGITGEGDMLAALGYTYGTDEGNKFSEKIHKQLKHSAYYSSVIMAKERGPFPMYDSEREKNNPFILRIKKEDPDLYNLMLKHGRRNIALLTIAPTGSVSLLTQTTSGIEPVFLPAYKRRVKINPNDKNSRVDFTDEIGDHWMEYLVFHYNFKTWLEQNGYDVDEVKAMKMSEVQEIIKKSPYYKATSNDVDWVKKVEMQGLIQQHVDHSISVTVNLPNDVTEETVAKVYETGWRSKCKGITVYRDGSRSGVLISDDDKKEVVKNEIFNDNHAPKRPKRLKADIVRFQNNLEKWVAVVGKLDDRPYEFFTGRLQNGLSELPTTIEQCEVVKKILYDDQGNRTKRYDIEYIDSNGEKVIYEGINQTFDPEYWNYAKLISSVMRHGMPTSYIYELVRSLNLNDEHLNTWKAGVERVIKRYIKDGEKTKDIKCPECGSKNLEFKEGCLTCVDCGSSKCS